MPNTGSLEALFAAGIAAQQNQQHAQAAALFARVLEIDPTLVAARHNLALSHRALGQTAEAETHWRQLLATAPKFALAPAALGNMLRAQALQAPPGQTRDPALAEARALHLNAIALEPTVAGHAHNLFLTLSASNAWDEAAAIFTSHASQHPKLPHYSELAARALVRLGRFEAALGLAQAALALAPNNIDALISQASCLRELGQAATAEQSLEHACRLDPNHAVANFNLAQLQCYRGRWSEGLAGIAADRSRQVQAGVLHPPVSARLWQGESNPQAHLLLLAEQGLGDTLQFVRYAKLARSRVGRVTLVPPAGLAQDHAWLQPLFSSVAGLDAVLRPSDPLPAADLFVPLFSLPHLCGPSPNKIFAPDHYLQPNPKRVAHWGQALGPRQGEFRVALAWQGNPQYRGDQRRSLPLTSFAPLVANNRLKVRWLSVQKGFGADQLAQWPAPCPIEDWGSRLDLGKESFSDTAGFLANVDLVITSDTALPHLAGALGKPTWMLLAAVPDWRWQDAGDLCPWFPSMRVFRQRSSGDWATTVDQVAHTLEQTLAQTPKR